jgi:hypothetical protein
VADTSAAAEAWGNIYPAGNEAVFLNPTVSVDGRSLVLFVAH